MIPNRQFPQPLFLFFLAGEPDLTEGEGGEEVDEGVEEGREGEEGGGGGGEGEEGEEEEVEGGLQRGRRLPFIFAPLERRGKGSHGGSSRPHKRSLHSDANKPLP